MKYFIYIVFFNFIFSQIHFINLPDSTGIYQPVIIEECIGLDLGDEIGLFDTNGLLSDDCSNQYGEILVGAGVYNGEQITISGFGSLNYCDFPNGYELPGYVNNNSIMIKVWDASENIEYIPESNYTTGSGNWGDIFSVIDILIVDELSISPINQFSLIQAYPNPFNSFVKFNIDKLLNEDIDVSIFNVYGQSIDNFLFKATVDKTIVWDASDYHSGIYLVSFKSQKFNLTKKITLLK